MAIDLFAFARRAERIGGELQGGMLARVNELGWSLDEGHYELTGGGAQGGPQWIEVQASGQLRAVCQRCLGALVWSLSTKTRLEIAESEAAIELFEDDVDRVAGDRSLDALMLVEDEIILALPMVGRHEVCVAQQSVEPQTGSLGRALGAWSAKRGQSS